MKYSRRPNGTQISNQISQNRINPNIKSKPRFKNKKFKQTASYESEQLNIRSFEYTASQTFFTKNPSESKPLNMGAGDVEQIDEFICMIWTQNRQKDTEK